MIKMRKIIVSLVLVWTFVCNSLPTVQAQDFISTSDDVSNGSSVFVMRQNRKANQAKVAFVRTKAKRTIVERKETRKKVKQQVVAVKKSKPKPVRATPPKKPVPIGVKPPKKNVPPTPPQIDTSEAFAVGADTYLERNEVDKSIALYRKSLEFNPKNKAAQSGLSEALTSQADTMLDKALAPDENATEEFSPESAAQLYLEATKLDTTNAAAYAGLGEAYDAIEDAEGSTTNKDKAISAFEKAVSLSAELTEVFAPLGILYFQKGEIAKAEGYLAKAVSANANDSETQYFLGLVRYKQNANSEALTALKKSIQLNKNFADAYYYLGEVYDRLDKDKEAIAAYNEAVKINPKYVEALFDLGVANYNRGNYSEAIDAYNRVKKVKNDYADAWLNLADVYRQLANANKKSPNLAKENYEKANAEYAAGAVFAERSKDYTELQKRDIYSKHAYCLGKTENWDVAITQINKAIAIKADEYDYTNLGWAYLNAARQSLNKKDQPKTMQNYRLAKEALLKAKSLNPKSIGGNFNLAVTHEGLGELQEAVEAMKTVNEQKSDWDIARYELGYAYNLVKDFANASVEFKRATELNKDFVDAYYYWGVAENALGRKDSAKEILKKLKAFNSPRARYLIESLDLTIKGKIINDGKRQVENKINEVNPIKKIPKIPKLPF
jgi:tetratricopeptide (TPR) repeat protein